MAMPLFTAQWPVSSFRVELDTMLEYGTGKDSTSSTVPAFSSMR